MVMLRADFLTLSLLVGSEDSTGSLEDPTPVGHVQGKRLIGCVSAQSLDFCSYFKPFLKHAWMC